MRIQAAILLSAVAVSARQRKEDEVETPEQAKARIKKERQEEEDYFKHVYESDDFVLERKKRDKPEGMASDSVATTREEQIQELEGEHYAMMQSNVLPAREKYEIANAHFNHAKQSGGWFPSAEQKQTIAMLEKEAAQARAEFKKAEAEAVAVYKQIKPLYGVLSSQHWAEHKRHLTSSLSWSADVGLNNAWWEALFRGHRSDNLGEFVAQLVLSFLSAFAMAYFFSFIHFLFTAPFLIAEYCSGIGDVPAAIIMFVVALFLFLLPVVLLCLGCAGVAKTAARKQREQQMQRQHLQQFGRIRYNQ